jgi:UDP-glucose 4-epimerase
LEERERERERERESDMEIMCALGFLHLEESLTWGEQVQEVFAKNAIDAVMHFAAVAYVGESMAEPLRLVISPSMPTTCC